MSCICQDCGCDYDVDMDIQDDLWKRISPSEVKDCGLLCPECICKRLIALGMTAVRCMVDCMELVE